MNEDRSETAARGLKLLDGLADEAELPQKVRHTAFDMYRQVVEQTDLSGRSIKEIASGTLLLAVKRNSEPINVDELVETCPSTRRSVFREKNRIQSTLGIKTEPVTAEDYLDKYCEKLSVDNSTKKRTTQILKESEDNGFMQAGKSPRGVAAGVLYLGALLSDADQRLTQSELAEMAGVTEVTLRTHYRNIAEKAGYESEIEQAMENRA